jgi:hypothetical protein
MAIHSRQNLYRGVNAHLHSQLQHEPGGWEVFHGMHIIHLAESIDALLPTGYLVDPEKSLQIRERHPDSGEIITETWQPRPDITIYDQGTSPSSPSTPATSPTLTLPASASIDLDEQIYLRAIIIREVNEQGELGKPITWIELLSPTNKPPNTGYRQYREKRNATIQSGIALIEIDYLHETRSPIQRPPSYPHHEAGAFPYAIVVTNPRPSLEAGFMQVYGFRVDDPIPTISIPLSSEDALTLDMNAVYQRTFSSLASFSQRVDYEQLPVNFTSYDDQDQQRIKSRMEAVTSS